MQLYENFHKKTSSQKKLISDNNFTYSIILPVLKKYIKPNSRILDYGSGAGVVSMYLASEADEVVGIDVSKIAVNASNKTAKELNIKNGKYYLPKDYKSKKKFDYILLLEVIEHVKQQDKLLKDLNKKLKKNGILILSTPSKKAPLYRLGLTKNFDKEVGHVRRYKASELRKLVEKNNFKIIDFIPNEGIVRNSLFILKPLGFLVRFVKGPLVPIVLYLDKLSMHLFGESDYIVVAKKT